MAVSDSDTRSYSSLSLAIRLVQAVDAPDPVKEAVRAVADALDAGIVGYYAFDPIEASIRLTHASLPAVFTSETISTHSLTDGSIASRTLLEKQIVVVPHWTPGEEERRLFRAAGIAEVRNLISLPIIIGAHRRTGVLQAMNVGLPFSDDHALLEDIRTLFGAALESAERRTELATLSATISRVNRSLDLDETLDAVLAGVMTLVPCLRAIIYLDNVHPDALTAVAGRTMGTGMMYPSSQPRPLNESLTGWVYQHRQSVLVPDILEDNRVLQSGPDARPDDSPVRSFIMVPLLVGESPVGTLLLSRRPVNAFDQHDLQIVEQFAPLAAQAVTNARLFARTEQSRVRTERILGEMADAIVRMDIHSKCLTWNSVAEQLFGYTAAEVLGDFPPLVSLDLDPKTAGMWHRVIYGGESFSHIENRQQHRDGRWIDTLLSLSPWREHGEITGGLAVIRDITPLKNLERTLLQEITEGERRERDQAFIADAAQACNSAADAPAIMQALADMTAAWAASAAVFIFAPDGRHYTAAYASHNLEEDADIVAMLRAYGETDTPPPEADIAAIAQRAPLVVQIAGVPSSPLTDLICDHGYHSQAFVPIRAAGAIVGLLAAGARAAMPLLDTQSLATLELVAEQAGQAITKDRLLRQVRAQVVALEEANRHKDDFLASLSHELRTPLNAILGFGRLISDGLLRDADELHIAAEDIVTSGELLLTQVNDLLDMARVRAGQITAYWERVNVAECVRASERVLTPLVAAKKQHLVFSIPPTIPHVHADGARLQQVLINLLTNAHKFTPDDGEITVRATYDTDAGIVSIAVGDTGIGIAPENAAIIFEPFRRVETGYARAQGGTGLGLALSRQLVELMDGTLTLDSTPGVGSVFTVMLKSEGTSGE